MRSTRINMGPKKSSLRASRRPVAQNRARSRCRCRCTGVFYNGNAPSFTQTLISTRPWSTSGDRYPHVATRHAPELQAPADCGRVGRQYHSHPPNAGRTATRLPPAHNHMHPQGSQSCCAQPPVATRHPQSRSCCSTARDQDVAPAEPRAAAPAGRPMAEPLALASSPAGVDPQAHDRTCGQGGRGLETARREVRGGEGPAGCSARVRDERERRAPGGRHRGEDVVHHGHQSADLAHLACLAEAYLGLESRGGEHRLAMHQHGNHGAVGVLLGLRVRADAWTRERVGSMV